MKLFHPLLLNQADNRQRRMGGEGKEKWKGGGGGGGDGGCYSCPVMQGERGAGLGVTVHWRCSSFSFLPSLIPVSWKVSKWRVQFGFELTQKSTLSLSLSPPLYHQTSRLDMSFTKAGFNLPSPSQKQDYVLVHNFVSLTTEWGFGLGGITVLWYTSVLKYSDNI